MSTPPGLPLSTEAALERAGATAPCVFSYDLGHLWDHVSLHVWPWCTEELWRCVYCHAESHADPRPVDSWARRRVVRVVTAEEILSSSMS